MLHLKGKQSSVSWHFGVLFLGIRKTKLQHIPFIQRARQRFSWILNLFNTRCVSPNIYMYQAITFRSNQEISARVFPLGLNVLWLKYSQLYHACTIQRYLLFESDDVFVSGVDLGESQRQVVCFRAGVDEETDFQVFWKRVDDSFGAQNDVVVEETIVGV